MFDDGSGHSCHGRSPRDRAAGSTCHLMHLFSPYVIRSRGVHTISHEPIEEVAVTTPRAEMRPYMRFARMGRGCAGITVYVHPLPHNNCSSAAWYTLWCIWPGGCTRGRRGIIGGGSSEPPTTTLDQRTGFRGDVCNGQHECVWGGDVWCGYWSKSTGIDDLT